MSLEQIFSQKSIILNLESTEKDELFEEMLEAIVAVQPNINRKEALDALNERESKMNTGIMHNIAIPHGNCASAHDVVGAIGISHSGIEYDSLDKAPVYIVFMLLCNPSAVEQHLAVLKDLASVLQNPSFVKEIMEKNSQSEVKELLCKYNAAL